MKLRTRIILSYFIVFGIGLLYIAYWVLEDLELRYREAVEEMMVDEAHVLASIVSHQIQNNQFQVDHFHQIFDETYKREFAAQIFQFVKTHVDLRVYVTDAKGIVIFDSTHQDEGKDYSQWNDVFLTLQGKYGTRSTRTNPDDEGTTVLHVAAPIILHGNIAGVLTIAKPTTNISLFLETAKYKTFNAGVIAFIAIILLNTIILIWFTRPIKLLTQYAQAIRDGKSQKFPELGKGEIAEMGNAFEEMREALENKKYVEEYVQTLTHELKSPISAIKGAAELLENDMPEHQRHRFLSNIQAESLRLEQVVVRMLKLASLENQKTLQHAEPFLLAPKLEAILANLEPLFLKKEIVIQSDISQSAQFWGDNFLLEQAIINLLQNAIDFSPFQGTIRIHTHSHGKQIQFLVEDEGPGIPEYAQQKIFDKFFSLHRPDTGKKSTGLGLNFVQEVAKLHNGSIALANRSPSGLQACFSIPSTSGQ